MQNLEIFKEIQKISKEINELTRILKNFTEILIFNIERVYRGYDEIW